MEAPLLATGEIPKNFGSAGYGTVTHGSDESLFVEFYWDIKKSHFQGDGLFRISDAGAGNIGKRILMIKIHSSLKSNVIREATDYDQRRFARQYQAFLAGDDQKKNQGTPLEFAPFLDPAWIEHLNFHKVYSLEQLVAVDDARRSNFPPGFLQVQQKTKDFLDMVKKAAPISKLEQENEELKASNSEQKEEIAALSNRLSVMEDLIKNQQPKKRGPKPKEQENAISG